MNLSEIEKKYYKELKDISEWVHLRIAYYFNYRNLKNKTEVKDNKIITRDRIKLLFYGFRNWFRGYNYIFITSSGDRKNIDNIFYNKNFDTIASNLNGKSLFIESINSTPIPLKDIYTQFIVSDRVINELVYRLSKRVFLYKKIKLDKREDLRFLKKFHIYLDYTQEIYIYEIYKFVYRQLFKIYRPKIIFINCSYCSSFIVKAAHELDILVVEIQHGTADHSGYKSILPLDECYFPDIFLSFGEEERYIDNFLLKKIVPVGSFYLEYIAKEFNHDQTLKQIADKYEITFSVTMMNILVPKVINFIKSIAETEQNYLFILIPKSDKDSHIYEQNNLSSNIITYKRLDCYNILMHSDIHVTVASTCALEAPSLGIVNILLDIDSSTKLQNRSILSKKDTVLSEEHTIIVKDKNEFIDAVNKLQINSSFYNIKELNNNVFVQDYDSNIKQFISSLDEK